MQTIETGRWLVVALVVVGLAIAASAVSAHGTDATTDHPSDGTDAPPYNGTAAEWTDWMGNHMTAHVGPGSVAWMESHLGVTVKEMAQYKAASDYTGHGPGFQAHEHADDGRTGGSVHDDTYREDSHRDDTGGHGMVGHGC